MATSEGIGQFDEATNDFPLKRCVDSFSDPCRAGTLYDSCYEFLMTHGPGWAMKPLKRLFDKFLPNLGFPGMGVDGVGRRGKQKRLRDLLSDSATSNRDKGWIRQELNQMKRGKRSTIRVPPGKELAHRRGFEAKNGFGCEYSDL